MTEPTPRAFSLIGMLITLVCMVVLFTIGMNAMNKAVTGQGSAVQGTVHSTEDQIALYALHQSFVVGARDFRDRFITPSLVTGSEDIREDTTANLFSVMVMQQYAAPKSLISANEFSGYVDRMESYDFAAYRPREGSYWDPKFKADLAELSHVSYAHMPLFGERFKKNWQAAFTMAVPIMGNRGPRDGVDDPMSWTYGRSGVWGGHMLFADGSIDFVKTFTPSKVFFEVNGQRQPDNIFAVEDGPGGADAILSFTKRMSREGPELQFD